MTPGRCAFSFVLHSHLPYVRRAGQWPFGEEWVYEALLETYLPLAELLERLTAEGVRLPVTLGITPILAEQLADPEMQGRFAAYLQDKKKRAAEDLDRFQRGNCPAFAETARDLLALFERIEAYYERSGRNVLKSFARLEAAGALEIMTSAATHAYLPLLSRDSSIQAQLIAGVAATERAFGRRPSGVWLPECAYRPGQVVEVTRNESYWRPPLDNFLSSVGLKYFIVDSQAIDGGSPAGGGKRHGLYDFGPSPADRGDPAAPRSLFRPYLTRSGVAVFGRNRETSLQVWSGDVGYPADPVYREFHKKDPRSGLHYWKITGKNLGLEAKEPYRMAEARARARAHARHFVDLVQRLGTAFQSQSRERGIVAAPYDTELFGHWWFEGLWWLEEVSRALAESASLEATSLGRYLAEEPSHHLIELPETSWGRGGLHDVWDNEAVHWMWPEIHAAEVAMEELVADFPSPGEPEARYLKQAGRELLLMQSSDWPFLVTTGQAGDYAAERFRAHRDRFETLRRILREKKIREPDALVALTRFEQMDNCFPDLNPDWFARRQPAPVPAAARG
jgi:1,4-alpha-glucan branching enzyme